MSGRRDDIRTLIGMADGEFATTVEPDGTLVREYGDAPTDVRLYEGRLMSPIPGYELSYGATVFAFGDDAVPLRDLSPRQELLDGRLPIVVTHGELDGTALSVLSFGWHVEGRLVDFTRLAVRNDGSAARSVPVWVGQRGQRRTLDALREFPRPGDLGWRDDLLVLDDRIYLVSDPAPSATGGARPSPEELEVELSALGERLQTMPADTWDAELETFEATLESRSFELAARYDLEVPAGGERHVWIKTPVHVHTESAALALRAASGDACLEAARAAWAELLAPAARVELPDAHVEDMYWAAVAAILLLRRRVGDHYLVYPGKRAYRRFWTRDAAYMCWALDIAGLPVEAERSLAYFLHLQRHPEERWVYAGVPPLDPFEPQKSFECPTGQYDGQGHAPWALLEHYRLTRDEAWLARVYPGLLDAAEWIRDFRALQDSPRYRVEAPVPGLLPPSIGEGWSNDPDFYLVHQVWALHGLDCVREAAAQLGREADRNWIADEYADFRAALLRAIDRGYVEEDGVARLAMVPAPERDVNSSLTQQHIAFLVWPRAVEGIEEGRVERLFASYAEAFAPEGLLGYKVYPHHGLALRELLHRRGTYRAAGAWPVRHRMNWSYGSCDMARALLELGRPTEATAIFERFGKLATPTNGWVEMVDLDRNTGFGDQPHGWAAAGFVTLLRLLIVRESGSTLRLLEGIPRHWLEAGARIAITDLPTYFGPLSLCCEATADTVELTLAGAFDTAPETIVVNLARPGGVIPRNVIVDGNRLDVHGAEIAVAGRTRRILARFAGEDEGA